MKRRKGIRKELDWEGGKELTLVLLFFSSNEICSFASSS